ncbi:MAG: hypothetical protein H0V76_01360 [Blastocatellia bacterium]|nr:hypothetical protein [Blastocatellia bacterium]
MQDIKGSCHVEQNPDHPIGAFVYTISLKHCMTVSPAYEGEGLGAMWGEETAVKMIKEAGFNNVDTHYLDHDIMNAYYVATK